MQGLHLEYVSHRYDAVVALRELDLAKPPGVAETIDWVEALQVVGADDLDRDVAVDTLGAVIKDRDDLDIVGADLGGIIADG